MLLCQGIALVQRDIQADNQLDTAAMASCHDASLAAARFGVHAYCTAPDQAGYLLLPVSVMRRFSTLFFRSTMAS